MLVSGDLRNRPGMEDGTSEERCRLSNEMGHWGLLCEIHLTFLGCLELSLVSLASLFNWSLKGICEHKDAQVRVGELITLASWTFGFSTFPALVLFDSSPPRQ